jgi:hypothetical protein
MLTGMSSLLKTNTRNLLTLVVLYIEHLQVNRLGSRNVFVMKYVEKLDE